MNMNLSILYDLIIAQILHSYQSSCVHTDTRLDIIIPKTLCLVMEYSGTLDTMCIQVIDS